MCRRRRSQSVPKCPVARSQAPPIPVVSKNGDKCTVTDLPIIIKYRFGRRPKVWVTHLKNNIFLFNLFSYTLFVCVCVIGNCGGLIYSIQSILMGLLFVKNCQLVCLKKNLKKKCTQLCLLYLITIKWACSINVLINFKIFGEENVFLINRM